MNKLLTLAIVAGMAPLGFAIDGNTASATAQAYVTILAPVTVTTSGDLQFGKVIISDYPAIITIDKNATVTTNSNASLYRHAGATSVPTFTVTRNLATAVQVEFAPTFSQGGTFAVDQTLVDALYLWGQGSKGPVGITEKLRGTLTFAPGTTPLGEVTGSIVITASYI